VQRPGDRNGKVVWQEDNKRKGNDRRLRGKGNLTNALEAIVNVFLCYLLFVNVPLFLCIKWIKYVRVEKWYLAHSRCLLNVY